MARYIATSGTYFNPLDYDTLMKPVQAMQERHDAAADAYDTLNLETEAIRQYITENPGDKRALAIYNNYHDKLSKLQNGLWENGVTSQTRRDLSSARAGFAEVGKIRMPFKIDKNVAKNTGTPVIKTQLLLQEKTQHLVGWIILLTMNYMVKIGILIAARIS